MQKQRNIANGVGALERRSSSISQEIEQHGVVIEEVNPPSKMGRVVVPSEHKEEQPIAQLTVLPLMPINQKRTMVKRAESVLKRFEPKRTIALVTKVEAAVARFQLPLCMLYLPTMSWILPWLQSLPLRLIHLRLPFCTSFI